MATRPVWYDEPWRGRQEALALLRETTVEAVITGDSASEVEGVEKRIATPEAAEYRAYLQERCRVDFLFLGRLLGYRRLLDRVHGPVAAFTADKKTACVIIAQAHEADDPEAAVNEKIVRQFLHLDPRKTFKSTAGIIDAVQWIINLANIRICVLTATKPLASAIAGEITDHFVRKVDDVFQELFPEYVIAARDKRIGEYTAPCRAREWKEATVMAFSIETSQSGWHFDVLNVDDVVETQNSSTPASIEKVKNNFRVNKKTLMPWGWVNFKGTRYNPFDLWGDIIDKARPSRIKMLIRPAVRRLDGRRIEPGDFPQAHEVELLFPELLSYEFLREQFEDDYTSFMTQFQNDAMGGNEVVFRREDMLAATKPADEIPLSGQMFCAWRFAYQGKPAMKYAAGVVGLMDQGRLYIVDAVRGTFTPSALAHRVAQLAKKYAVHTVTIEESPGARYAEPAIINYALALGWALTIRWLEYQDDDGARGLRLRGLEPLVVTSRLLFSESIACLKEIYRQFGNFGMVDENELVDTVARVAEVLPAILTLPEQQDEEQNVAWELAKQRDLYDRTHGLGRYTPPEEEPEEKPLDRPGNDYGLDDCLGGLNG